MREWIQDALFYLCAIPLVLGMCAVYWMCRLCGIDLNDDY